MDQNHDEEMQEMMEEMAEDLEHTQLNEKNLRQPKKFPVLTRHGQIMVYSGLGIIVLIILGLFFFSGGGKVSRPELEAIKTRLDRMENRLIQLENAGQKFSPTEGRIKGMEKSLSKLDRTVRALREQLNKQSKRVDRIKDPLVTKKKSEAQKRYHEIRRGETLYGIAKKYNVSVDDLRRLNKFSKSQNIYPGQKIIIP